MQSAWKHPAFLAAAGIVALSAAGLSADWWFGFPPGVEPAFVGRETCAQCHQAQLKSWTGSHHDKAMDLATDETVLGDFNDATFTHFETTSRMFKKDGRFFFRTDGADGKLADFEVKYVFGVDPLQQYMVEFPDGRVQVLSVAWDTVGQRWYHLYPDEAIPHTDELHWTKPAQNWNYMCAECHSTNLQKNYDLAKNEYHTTFSEIDVSCEACHGPGGMHLEMAKSKSPFWDRNYGYGLAKLKGTDTKAELETCAKCHSRRRIVHPNYSPGRELLDYYEPEILDNELYYADGQIREEVYEYGSFLQSLMYRKNVRCSNCHEPHSSKLRFPGNQLCGQCHVPGKYDTPAHHHHPPDAAGNVSKGAACVECHMPETNYMVVDPRRDHSIRVPRPDMTLAIGTPNACNKCHLGPVEDARWAAQKIVDWYGPKRRDDPHFGLTIAAGRTGHVSVGPHGLAKAPITNPAAEQREIVTHLRKLAVRKDVGPTVRASAVALLGNYGGTESVPGVIEALTSPDALSRAAAVRNVEPLLGVRGNEVANVASLSAEEQERVGRQLQQLKTLLVPSLHDPVRAVRGEAARVLSLVPEQQIPGVERPHYEAALAEYVAGQTEVNDQPGAHLTMGVLLGNQGKLAEAERSYLTALRLAPDFVPARVNLAMQYEGQGRKKEAEKLLREVTKLAPQFADGHYSLALLLAETEDGLPDAAKSLAAAVKLAPGNPRMQYNLGLALQQLGNPQEAEVALKEAWRLDRGSAEYLNALALLYAQERQWPKAIACAEELTRLLPNDQRAQQMLASFKSQAERSPAVIGPAPK